MSKISNPILLEDIFEIKQVNPDGKKFDKGDFLIKLYKVLEVHLTTLLLMN